jgi:small subunit ribosomal protein S9
MTEDERRDTPQEPEQPEGGEQPEPEEQPEAREQPEGGPEEAEGAPERPAAAGEDQVPGAQEAAAAEPSGEVPSEAGGADAPGETPEGAPGEPGGAAPSAEEEGAPEAAPPEAAPPEAVSPEAARQERPKPGARRRRKEEKADQEVIPGAHLEPDLVLEEEAREGEVAEFPGAEVAEEAIAEEPELVEEEEEEGEPAPVVREPLDLAADARYAATGKRKSAVARVILKPGDGSYRVNGRYLDEFFPRIKLQRIARQPLETAGYQSRLDVVARIHGGGVSAQAGALRHGVARALVEADPSLRADLKRRGFLTRDPRVKERKKAGLKKARKRPQFSKR